MAAIPLRGETREVKKKDAWRLYQLYSRALQSALDQSACQGMCEQLKILHARIGTLCAEGHSEQAAYIGNQFRWQYHNGQYAAAEHTAKCGL